MAVRRGIVQGYDSGLAQPKGVAGAIDVRQSVAALAQRTGVYWDREDPCTASGTATMDVDITSFRAAIESPLGGYYVVTLDEDDTVAIAASDSTNERWDIIYVNQEDYQVDGSQVDSEAVLEVATGTPALTPVDPDVPDGALALYRVEVPAGVTTTNAVGVVITSLFDYTAPVGTPIPVRTYTEMDAIVDYPGQRAKLLSIVSQPVYEHDGTEWRSVGQITVADATERNALSKRRTGDLAYTVSDATVYRWNGSAWKTWQKTITNIVPTWVNFTTGNGTAAFYYEVSSGVCHLWGKFTLGSTSSVGAGVSITGLPYSIDAAGMVTNQHMGSTTFQDTGTTVVYGAAVYSGFTTAVGVTAFNVAGTYPTGYYMTTTVPFTFVNTDAFALDFFYPVA